MYIYYIHIDRLKKLGKYYRSWENGASCNIIQKIHIIVAYSNLKNRRYT